MAMLFMFDERGAWSGTRVTYNEPDIISMRRQKFRFIEVERDIRAEEYYVPNPQDSFDNWHLQKRPRIKPTISAMSVKADGVDTLTISNLPIPVEVTIDGVPYIVEDGSLEFSADVVGTYRIEIDYWPYMEWGTTVRAI